MSSACETLGRSEFEMPNILGARLKLLCCATERLGVYFRSHHFPIDKNRGHFCLLPVGRSRADRSPHPSDAIVRAAPACLGAPPSSPSQRLPRYLTQLEVRAFLEAIGRVRDLALTAPEEQFITNSNVWL